MGKNYLCSNEGTYLPFPVVLFMDAHGQTMDSVVRDAVNFVFNTSDTMYIQQSNNPQVGQSLKSTGRYES